MPLDDPLLDILRELTAAGVEFVVIGGGAAVLRKTPLVTWDLDIVHRRTPENAERLMGVFARLDAYFRGDFTGRKLRPRESDLLGHGHVLLQTRLGKLDVLCEITGQRGYEELLPHAPPIDEQGLHLQVLDLPTLIKVKTEAGRQKDKAHVAMMVATLEEQKKRGA